MLNVSTKLLRNCSNGMQQAPTGEQHTVWGGSGQTLTTPILNIESVLIISAPPSNSSVILISRSTIVMSYIIPPSSIYQPNSKLDCEPVLVESRLFLLVVRVGRGCICWQCGFAGLPKNVEHVHKIGVVPVGVCGNCGSNTQTNFLRPSGKDGKEMPWIQLKAKPIATAPAEDAKAPTDAVMATTSANTTLSPKKVTYMISRFISCYICMYVCVYECMYECIFSKCVCICIQFHEHGLTSMVTF